MIQVSTAISGKDVSVITCMYFKQQLTYAVLTSIILGGEGHDPLIQLVLQASETEQLFLLHQPHCQIFGASKQMLQSSRL